ncbi:TetR/AcrR family transcriptional regulator [Pseudomonas sp. SWI6]|uniref:TetR/AcrR family transcriptional regulator n=1 Tax=Pseudomonas taiwanensis TaxID=470150 RepID=A0ABR6V471_9PSED|nr:MULTISPECIES: TetR/AcrR family transcriptional regulator [Pseudomonas]AGZ34926.1 TetR family transcriptional regulator [Pseudomonas sp. VLB120]AVD83578.1 TetR/AcrR family transcriptional regulator [Pseudomonas sp. SWI6]AVD85726.1 TetR/AcrR family transcriptional regulator [Pseudomonas sp. SWI44]MBC3475208.1 TetR/AcrR family transcriptional regulator [Pseudomonas taiwanensis]MBC3490180.1 TetR/AcrR family transcriptional regulator [Pseudomonas taiwanensis]
MTTPNVRPPQQDRSRQSLEKVLTAARQLLCESLTADLTLIEVSKAAGVSIGSIYGRFKGKDDLLQVVFEDALEKMDLEWQSSMRELGARQLDLSERLPLLVDTLAEHLARHAAILKPFMNRASHADIARSGKEYHARMAAAFMAQINAHQDEIRHPDPDRAIHSCFRIIYSSLARFLGLGSAADAAGEGDWNHLKQDLGTMSVLFLTH